MRQRQATESGEVETQHAREVQEKRGDWQAQSQSQTRDRQSLAKAQDDGRRSRRDGKGEEETVAKQEQTKAETCG